MAFSDPIGNPLESQGHSDFTSDDFYRTMGPVDESALIPAPEATQADADEDRRRHLSLVSNEFEELFDTVEEQWQDRALCAQTDPEAFFPEKGGSTREAKRICSGCEVKAECLEYALANDERFGIWGGLSERERRRLKRGII
ncbi:WhiB family transcriptional regulator [Gordonia desulfuricans]|uniref:Transcriptional regulator WhiB n=1 Tax=Gordonia desulfuricans TaxID=89051 RepID=A0A7K3LIR3_9ACTN|nr:transcription factor WhiB [Gordonia sp. NB41Y]NDK88063.1 WhiB family transcriptional regulator [Gordonia desulfuricans]